LGLSPQAGWQAPLPQAQAGPQSAAQPALVSPHWGWQMPLPHWQGVVQSCGHEALVSPQPA